MVRDAHHQVHVVLHQNDGLTSLFQLQDQIPHGLRLPDIQSGHRLIQKKKLRIPGHGPGNFQPPLVGYGNLAGRLRFFREKSQKIEERLRLVPDFLFFSPFLGKMENPSPKTGFGLGMHSHHHIFQNRQVVEKLRLLERPMNPQGRNLVRHEPGNRISPEEDFPGIQGINPGNGIQQGCLPRPIGSDEGNDPTRIDGKGKAVQRLQAAEAKGNISSF
ncbi:MAG: hypothetical protein AMJ94_14850 [Deltaproteobacteria bacterium SM23_61]|nr:MAG: hypothetical protein AMJ94_14850 [Deltaproteobacteria bacterium SM23_61]